MGERTKTVKATKIAKVAVLLAEWFGVGRLKAPGTMASIAVLPILWLVQGVWGLVGQQVLVVVLFALGLVVVSVYHQLYRRHDPSEVVIDEVFGMAVCVCFLPLDPAAYALGFLLFRVCDISKVYPIFLIDRYGRGSPGVMLDDGLAGLFAGIVGYAIWPVLEVLL